MPAQSRLVTGILSNVIGDEELKYLWLGNNKLRKGLDAVLLFLLDSKLLADGLKCI